MSFQDITTSDRIRIAIALTALKFKPSTQSCTAYALDLCAWFPASQVPHPSSLNASWRDYALRLEQNVRDLELKYEAEHTKSLSLSSALDKASEDIDGDSSLTCDQSKKRSKKKLGNAGIDRATPRLIQDLSSAIKGLHADHISVGYSVIKSGCLIKALDSFVRSTSLALQSRSHSRLLFSSACKAIDAVSSVLAGPLSGEIHPVLSHLELINMLSPVVYHLSSTTAILMLVFGETSSSDSTLHPLDTFFDKLLHLTTKLARSFLPLSISYIRTLHQISFSNQMNTPSPDSTSKGVKLAVDVRRGVLTFIQSVCCCLNPKTISTIWLKSLQKNQSKDILSTYSNVLASDVAFTKFETLRASMILEGIRELETILRISSRNQAVVIQKIADIEETEAAASRLAAKDAIWYICNLLHSLAYDIPSRRAGESRH
ncbi:hypothetical protein BDQ17DRAFT_920 [Cyathus striatus]|nr:hypothetical protein BDQ17DRAFT_920 [Cyathus striatus]